MTDDEGSNERTHDGNSLIVFLLSRRSPFAGGRGSGGGCSCPAIPSRDILTLELRSARMLGDLDGASSPSSPETLIPRLRPCASCNPASAAPPDAPSALTSGNAVISPPALTVWADTAVVGAGDCTEGNIDVPRTVAFDVFENLARRRVEPVFLRSIDSDGREGSGGGTVRGMCSTGGKHPA
jgi:hypothetical protein